MVATVVPAEVHFCWATAIFHELYGSRLNLVVRVSDHDRTEIIDPSQGKLGHAEAFWSQISVFVVTFRCVLLR